MAILFPFKILTARGNKAIASEIDQHYHFDVEALDGTRSSFSLDIAGYHSDNSKTSKIGTGAERSPVEMDVLIAFRAELEGW